MKKQLNVHPKGFASITNANISNEEAIIDILDNCFDADSKTIKVLVDKKLTKILIADDGIGMTDTELDNALDVGSNDKESGSLGKFGVGLKISALSMGNKLTILTKTANSKIIHSGIIDMDLIAREQLLFKDIDVASEVKTKLFYEILGQNAKQGTLIIIDKLERIKVKDGDKFISRLNYKIAETFAKRLLKKDVDLSVNGKTISGISPLMEDDKETENTFNAELKFESSEHPNIRFRLFKLPKKLNYPEPIPSGLLINQDNQGAYVYRNGRLITRAFKLIPEYVKHPTLNRIRMEVEFHESLDSHFTLTTHKNYIALSEEVETFMRKEVGHAIESLVKDLRKESETTTTAQELKKKTKHIETINHIIDDMLDTMECEHPSSDKKVNTDRSIVITPPSEKREVVENVKDTPVEKENKSNANRKKSKMYSDLRKLKGKLKIRDYQYRRMGEGERMICSIIEGGDIVLILNLDSLYVQDLKEKERVNNPDFMINLARIYIEKRSEEKMKIKFDGLLNEDFEQIKLEEDMELNHMMTKILS